MEHKIVYKKFLPYKNSLTYFSKKLTHAIKVCTLCTVKDNFLNKYFFINMSVEKTY